MSWSIDDRATTERWLRRRGLPHLIPGWSTAEDALTRATPFLALVFLAEVLSSFTERRRGWGQFAVFVGAAVVLLGAAALLNVVRGRRVLSLPDRVRIPELVLFLVVPASLPLLFDDLNWERAGLVLVQGVVVLAVTVVVVDYALLPMGAWAVNESVRTLRLVAQLASRTLPTLLLLVTFIFLNAEMWQVAYDFTGWRYLLTLLLFLAVGSAFVLSNTTGRSGEIAAFDDWAQVDEVCAEAGCEVGDVPPPAGPPDVELGPRARVNIVMVLFLSQGLQVLVVALAVFAFYLVFGVLTVPPPTVVAWVGHDPHLLVDRLPDWLDGVPVVTPVAEHLSLELLRVAGFIGAFAGLQVAISSTIDDSYRREFLGRISAEVREAVGVSLRLRARELTAPVPEPADGHPGRTGPDRP
ncbi:MAG: hypothetical protein REI45_13030 [Propionicimonas sp.]|nr:hypothetical protein [Propionicimonas sp.]